MRGPPLRLAAIVLAAVALAAAAPLEPEGLWTGPPHGETPATLRGATVLDLAALEAWIAASRPVLLDVAQADRRPDGLAPDAPWLPVHRSIPGAVWTPGAGAAPITAADEARFAARVDALTGGDHARPVVTFCHPQCWASWNAAKRLVGLGYTRVAWFPAGVDGWRETQAVAVVAPDAVWMRQ